MNISNRADTRSIESSKEFLIEGNKHYVDGNLKSMCKSVAAKRLDTADNGQFPQFTMVGFPGINNAMFDACHGDVFNIRYEGIPCNAEVLSSVLYSVEHLNVPYIAVMGEEGFKGNKNTLAQAQKTAKELMANPTIAQRIADGKLLMEVGLLNKSGKIDLFNVNDDTLAAKSAEIEANAIEVSGAKSEKTAAEVEAMQKAALEAGAKCEYKNSDTLVADREHAAANGKDTLIAVSTCADSRLPFGLQASGLPFGSVEEISVAGAFDTEAMRTSILAAVEKGAKVVSIVAHSKCGAVGAAYADHKEEGLNGFLTPLKAMKGLKDMDSADAAAFKVATTSAEIVANMPELKDKIANKELIVNVLFFDIRTGGTKAYSIADAQKEVASHNHNNINNEKTNAILKEAVTHNMD